MKKTPLERLMDTHPELEIWWDSSPWCMPPGQRVCIKKTPADRAGELRGQLKRWFDPEHPEQTLFRGVTTNPPLSLAVIKTHESFATQLVDDLIEKNPCIDTEALFWQTYKEIVRRGSEMYLGVFQRSHYRYGYLSGQVDPRAAFRSGEDDCPGAGSGQAQPQCDD